MQAISALHFFTVEDYQRAVKLTGQLTIRLSEETRRKLKARATQSNRSEAYIVREIVETHLAGGEHLSLKETSPPYKTKKTGAA